MVPKDNGSKRCMKLNESPPDKKLHIKEFDFSLLGNGNPVDIYFIFVFYN